MGVVMARAAQRALGSERELLLWRRCMLLLCVRQHQPRIRRVIISVAAAVAVE
jgi:hypothetical protein